MRTIFIKQSFLIVSLLFTTAMYAVSCVKDGMNLWRLTENVSCSVGAVCEINQGNFGNTITQSGHYKVCEDIDGTGAPGIVINADNVVLDFGGYVLSNMFTIFISSGIHNVVIKNGTLKDTNFGITIDGSGHNNIVIEDIVIDRIVPFLVGSSAFAIQSSGDLGNLWVRNFTIFDGSSTNIIIDDSLGSNQNIYFENVVCVNTNSDFTDIPVNPSAVIDIRSCNTLTMRNISLVDQWEELNMVRIDNSDEIDVDGVTISSLPGSPVSLTAAYIVSNSTSGLHKNIHIDGGSDAILTTGIDTTGSTNMIFDACYVENVADAGIIIAANNQIANSTVTQCGGSAFDLGNGVYADNCIAMNSLRGFNVSGNSSTVKNCTALNTDSFGFLIGGDICHLIGCVSSYHAASGFSTEALNVIFDHCISTFNTDSGIQIFGNGCSLNACTANNNNTGFEIAVTDGCFITDSIANDNTVYGFIVSNINAEAVFSAPNTPTNGTWNVGQGTVSLPTTNSRNVRLVNNTALRNGSGGFKMSGTIYDTNLAFPSTAFSATPIFPPIGVVNTIRGLIYPDLKPLPGTAIGALTGLVGAFANTLGGNLVNDIPASSI